MTNSFFYFFILYGRECTARIVFGRENDDVEAGITRCFILFRALSSRGLEAVQVLGEDIDSCLGGGGGDLCIVLLSRRFCMCPIRVMVTSGVLCHTEVIYPPTKKR